MGASSINGPFYTAMLVITRGIQRVLSCSDDSDIWSRIELCNGSNWSHRRKHHGFWGLNGGKAEVSYLGADRADGKGVPGHGPNLVRYPQLSSGFWLFLPANGWKMMDTLGIVELFFFWKSEGRRHGMKGPWPMARVGHDILAIPKITKQVVGVWMCPDSRTWRLQDFHSVPSPPSACLEQEYAQQQQQSQQRWV